MTTSITGLKNPQELLVRQLDKVVSLLDSGKMSIPIFQRKAEAWVSKQEQELAYSFINGLRLPVIDTQRFNDGSIYIDDGQQRIMNGRKLIKGKIKIDKPKPSTKKYKDRKEYFSKYGGKRFFAFPKEVQKKIKDYPISFAEEISDDENDGRDYYVRSNTLGSKINRPEINKAYYNDTAFWKLANNLSKKYRSFYFNYGVLTETKIGRSEDHLLTEECLVLIQDGAQSSGKLKAYYEQWKNQVPNKNDTVQELEKTFAYIKKVFPKGLAGSRFNNVNNFYALVGAISAKLKTTNKLKNAKTVNKTLTRFMSSVFNGRTEKQAKNYWETLQEGTKNKAHRKDRIRILCAKI